MSAPDYRALLVRYMAAVIDAEGVDFIASCGGYVVSLTDDEKAQLAPISTEARQVVEAQTKIASQNWKRP